MIIHRPGGNLASDPDRVMLLAEQLPPWSLPTRTDAGIVSRTSRDARLHHLVDTHIYFVARLVRNLGIPEGDVDDAVQRTFMVLANRLDDVRTGAEKAFLFRTATRVAAHGRRALARRREVGEDQLPERADDAQALDEAVDRRRARAMLDTVLDRLDEDLRTTFVLYEIEELTMAEIAETLEIPPGTVASRLRRARAKFQVEVRALQAGLPKTEAS